MHYYLFIIGLSYSKPLLNIIKGKEEYKIEAIVEYNLKNT